MAERDADANRGDRSNLPRPAEADIQRWVGEPYFGRGRQYFHEGNIFDTRLQGQALKARCLGSQLQPYRVQAHLGPAGLVSADCSCPVGVGGADDYALLALAAQFVARGHPEPAERLVRERAQASRTTG
jgi:uncharacterized Zn finger protein